MKKLLILSVFVLGGYFFITKLTPKIKKNKDSMGSDFEAEYKEYEVKEYKNPRKLTRREYIDKYY
jgi:hypothetical protein